MKQLINSIRRFTLRTDQDTSVIIRSSYELERQRQLREEGRTLSLNDYLVGLIETAIIMSVDVDATNQPIKEGVM
jgi:hypothetical protein